MNPPPGTAAGADSQSESNLVVEAADGSLWLVPQPNVAPGTVVRLSLYARSVPSDIPLAAEVEVLIVEPVGDATSLDLVGGELAPL